MEKKYYEAYDDRFRQIHEQDRKWFSEDSSPIAEETICTFSISSKDKLLEIGCGEGRDAHPLLLRGFERCVAGSDCLLQESIPRFYGAFSSR